MFHYFHLLGTKPIDLTENPTRCVRNSSVHLRDL